MRSSRDTIGLAFLRLDAITENRSLSAEGATLAALRPDWMRIESESPSPAPREREGPAPAGAGG